MNATLPPGEQLRILMAGTEFGEAALRTRMEAELLERLAEGRPLRVYLGIDPTSPDIHLGHTVPLAKLRDFQRLGHEVTFLIGSFTARIGDPSGKDKTRSQLSVDEIAANVRTYTEQAFKVIDRDKTRIRYNAEWLGGLDFADVIELASNFTVQQFLQRDNFEKRLQAGEPIFLHEFFYALMQGRDAVALETDVQVGGTDQTFNMLAGRTLQSRAGQKPHVVLTLPLIPGTDGTLKMSKSLGNAIEIDTTPEDMVGKIMSIPDEVMPIYYRQLTLHDPDEMAAILAAIESGATHPRDAKLRLAREITTIFHGEEGAARGVKHFVDVFQKRGLPEEIEERAIEAAVPLVDLIHEAGLSRSRNEARRLVGQNAVSIDDVKITDAEHIVDPSDEPRVLRVGKRRFLKLV